MNNTPVTKFDVVEFTFGATIRFQYQVENIVSANLIFSSPQQPRIVVVPYRIELDEWTQCCCKQ